MRRWMVFPGVAIAGIILAILLLPNPKTGAPPAPPASSTGAVGPPERQPASIGRPGRLPPPGVLKKGPSLVGSENIARMAVPEALFAGRLTSPLAVVRRQLQLTGDPNAEAIGVQADALIGQLREQRRDPHAHDFSELIVASRAWLDTVRTSPWGSDPEIVPQFARFEQIALDFQTAKDNPGAPHGPPGGSPTTVPHPGE